MNKSFIFVSLILHLIILYSLFYFLPKDPPPIVDEKITVSIVTPQENENVKELNKKIEPNEVIINNSHVETNIDKPLNNSYIDDSLDYIEPDLIVQNREIDNNIEVETVFDLNDFESELQNFTPDDILFPEEEKSDDIQIEWSNKSRTLVTNSYIDFATFPENTFTGVGARVSFMVTEDGDVFKVKVLPPGSGSVEFDILIEQYVSKFKFESSNEVSEGEIDIVYNK